MPFKAKFLWTELFWQVFVHGGFAYGIYLIIMNKAKLVTVLFAAAVAMATGFGLSVGGHRYWAHRAFKAKLPLQLLLLFLFCTSGQGILLSWAIEHRLHHKYTGTVADPHDARRGFWYAHIGWMVMTKHPAVENRKEVMYKNSQDLLNDTLVMFQLLMFFPLFMLCCVFIPVWIPYHFWNESLAYSFILCFVTRFVIALNVVFTINSFFHTWGSRPYNSTTKSTNAPILQYFAFGEGNHNFHHAFPCDYRCSESDQLNVIAAMIDLFAKIGWAYDLKSVPPSVISKTASLYGDGSYKAKMN